jgi:hypothetical protein
MKLYHGTSRKYLDKILKEGLKPRGKKGTNNWKHSVGSNPNTVYLTNAYAIYFAHVASDDDEDDMVVLEIETAKLNPFLLMPDEDFLEQVTRSGGPAPRDKSMKYRTMWYRRRLKAFQHLWLDSINELGTCGYFGNIPVAAMTRYSIIPNNRRAELIVAGVDPQISIQNYFICGDRYRNWTRWAFGDELVNNPNSLLRDPDYMKNIDHKGVRVGYVEHLT